MKRHANETEIEKNENWRKKYKYIINKAPTTAATSTNNNKIQKK